LVMAKSDLDAGLKEFEAVYYKIYRDRMIQKLGFPPSDSPEAENLLLSTLGFLQSTQVGYHDFFAQLRQSFSALWYTDPSHILSECALVTRPEWSEQLDQWRSHYHCLLRQLPITAMVEVGDQLCKHNPLAVPTRSRIEIVWEAISTEDNWQPFNDLVKQLVH
jgi:serine/tyrosine/threonine adenylyltransferase